MEKEKALKIVAELMEPFNNIALNYDKKKEWRINIPEKSGIFKGQLESLMEIVSKNNLDFEIEGDIICLWEKDESLAF